MKIDKKLLFTFTTTFLLCACEGKLKSRIGTSPKKATISDDPIPTETPADITVNKETPNPTPTGDGGDDSEEPGNTNTVPALPTVTGKTQRHGGYIKLAIDLPDDTSAYGVMTIRRNDGATPPENCDSGHLVNTITNFTEKHKTIFDTTGELNSTFSYRICVKDQVDKNEVSVTTNAIISGLGQRLFVSSTTHNGQLGGIAGADAICAQRASAAELPGIWKLHSYISVLDHKPWDDDLYNMASERTGFFSNLNLQTYQLNLLASLAMNEFGENVTGNVFSGISLSCDALTSASSGAQAYVASATAMDIGAVFSAPVSCDESFRLYCLQVLPIEKIALEHNYDDVQDDQVNIKVTFPQSTSILSRVELQRIEGTTAPDKNCSDQNAKIVKIWTEFSDGLTDTVLDSGSTSLRYSYRICAVDTDGDLVSRSELLNIRMKGYGGTRLFLASTSRNGAYGLSNFDADCSSQASANGLGSNYIALLASSQYPNTSRINVIGDFETPALVFSSSGAQAFKAPPKELRLASGQTILFYPIKYWTGMSKTLRDSDNCDNWSSTSDYSGSIGEHSLSSTIWLGNGQFIGCASAQRFICVEQPPHGLKQFLASRSSIPEEVNLKIVLPSIVTSYHEIKVIRSDSDFTTNNCAEGVTIFSSKGPFSADQEITLQDNTGEPNTNFNYRACAFSETNLVLGAITQLNVTSGGPQHTVFVTSTSHDGNLGGLIGADGICQVRANIAGLPGSYKAVLSDGVTSAFSRISITKRVYNSANYLVAESANQFWGDTAWEKDVAYDENGTPVAAPALVHSSSIKGGGLAIGGQATYHCDGYTNQAAPWNYRRKASSTEYFWNGHSATVCSVPARLLCISD